MKARKSVLDISRMKEQGEKITVLTAYDYAFARLMDNQGIDVILVGDSAGTVFSGYDNTLPGDPWTRWSTTPGPWRAALSRR